VVKTSAGDYFTTTHFTAELSITLAEDDLVYFGLGQAVNDAGYFNEPGNCLMFRIHNIGYSGIVAAATQVGGASHFLDNREIGTYVPGTKERFRIQRDGDYVTLSVPSQNVSRTYSISQ
jgi:hypothetical protein